MTLYNEEFVKKQYAFVFGYLKYAEIVKKRIVDPENVKIRVALQQFNGKYLKWLNEEEIKKMGFEEFYKTYSAVIPALHITKLPNHIVLELDIQDPNKAKQEYETLEKFLQNEKIKAIKIFSGNKSIHYHIFFDPTGKSTKELKGIREALIKFFNEFFAGFDIHSAKDTTPIRVPFSLNLKSNNYAYFVEPSYLNEKPFDFFLEKIANVFLEYENDISELEPKLKHNNAKIVTEKKEYYYPLILKNRESNIPKNGLKRKLYKLYEEIKQIKIEDGRDRVLMILFTIANFLNLPPEKFAKDIEEWAKLVEWKEYKWRSWPRYYEEGRYRDKWGKNWRWAIKEFLKSSDIDKESYEKIKAVIEKYFPDLIKKYLEGQ